MLVTITHVTGVTIDLPAQVNFAATVTRNQSTATVRISRDTLMWAEDYISEDGGMLVEIDTGLGRVFRGVSDVPRTDETGADLHVYGVMAWFGIRHVATYREFRSCPAGTIAMYAVRDGLVGLGAVPVSLGRICIGAPHIDEFIFSGQSVLDVLTSLTEMTGQEWFLDSSLRFHWQARQGRYREIFITDDGDFGTGSGMAIDDLAREVIETQSDGREWRVFNNRVPALWPRQEVTRP